MILSIGESHPKKFKVGAALIKKVEGTDHTHSFVSWRDTALDIRKVAEARGHGGRMLINRQFRKENHVVRMFQYELSSDKILALEKWLWEHMGPYGYLHMLGLGVMRLENRIRKTVNAPLVGNRLKDGDYSEICVELTAKALQIALNVDLPGDVENYGLIEMHQINMDNYAKGLCDLAPQTMIDQINARATA